MAIYSAKIRLQSSPMNEVLKSGLSAAEVVLLTAIHGEDAVVDVALEDGVRNVSPDDAAERERLTEIYEGYVAKAFGPGNTPLPREVPGVAKPEKVRRLIPASELTA